MSRMKNRTLERDDGYDVEYYTNEDFVSSADHEILKNQMQARFGILQNKIIYTIAGLICCFVGLLGFSIYIMVSQSGVIEAQNNRIKDQNNRIEEFSNIEENLQGTINKVWKTVTGLSPPVFELKLVGGDGTSTGNLYFGEYPICDDHWTNASANVACRMMGFKQVCTVHTIQMSNNDYYY